MHVKKYTNEVGEREGREERERGEREEERRRKEERAKRHMFPCNYLNLYFTFGWVWRSCHVCD